VRGRQARGNTKAEVAELLCSQNQNKESVLKTEQKRGAEVLRRVTDAAAVTFLFPVCLRRRKEEWPVSNETPLTVFFPEHKCSSGV
jgi:hypothetical protein